MMRIATAFSVDRPGTEAGSKGKDARFFFDTEVKMPWKPADCKSHNSSCTGKCCTKWADTANGVLKSELDKGVDRSKAEGIAIATANKSVKESLDIELSAVSFQEAIRGGPEPLKVDREQCIVFDVKILGPRSKNTGNKANDYPVATQKQAIGLIEGSSVYFDHKGDGTHCRDYVDGNGTLKNVRQIGDSLYANHHYNPKKPLTEAYLWDAEHSPQSVMFSINASGKRKFDKPTQRYIVESIDAVHSVDLVSKGGTTVALNENSDEPVIPADQQEFCTHGLSACSDAQNCLA